ncbi:MAG: ferritin family protein [Bacteroidales bacterium]|nr:ferritin family protein [Bacteroidales bacterium]MCK4406415.1 ferritin family protein [Bacteroidales bacterium]
MEEFKSINDILDFAIVSEQEAVDFYTKLSKQATNEAMKEVFLQFAKEEMGHKARLTNIKEKRLFEFKEEKVTDLKIADYLVESEAKPDMTYQNFLIVAMNKEKAAFKLYSDLAKIAPNNEIREIFLSLAQEEAKHKLRFEIEYDDYVLKEN